MKIIPINKFATGNYIKIQNKIFKSFHANPIHTLSKSNTKFIELFNFLNKSNSKTGVMPLVSIPIVAYMATTKKVKEEREYNKNEEASNRLKPNDTEWNEKKSRKILADHNITSKQEQDKYIGTDGKLNSDSNKKTPFKASTDDAQHFDSADTSYHGETYGDMPQIYEPETGIQGISQHAEIPNFDDAIGGTSVSEQLAEVADMLDNPVLTGVVAELLPGTKFFKPAKDLFDGDFGKAAIGTASRAGEILVSPVKLGWAAFGALSGTVSWLAGNRGEGTGFFGGAKRASLMWANGRNKLENTILDREEPDPNAKQVLLRNAYERATNAYVKRMNDDADDEIRNIKNSRAEEIKKNEIERLKAQKDYEIKHKSTAKIREKAYERTRQGQAHRQASKEYLRQLIAEKEQNFRYQQQMIAKLSEDIKNAENDCNTKLATELEKQKADLEKIFKAQAKQALGSINYILEIAKQYEQIYKKNDAQGFASVAGYKETKNQLAAMFGVPLIQNKKNPNVRVPNVIALYGPKGTGKTIFGASLAKQFDCINGGSLLLKVGDDINFSRLMKIANEAKTNFRKTGKRTIIQIDEVEFFGTKQTPSLWKRLTGKPENFEEFLSVCSEKYGCTLVVTTNEPDKIDNSIKSKMKFLYVPIANEDDMAEILKFHVNNRNKENINYKKLVALLIDKTKDGSAFTNARLEDIVKTVISRHGVLNQKLLEEEIENREPDISKEEINCYKKDFKL